MENKNEPKHCVVFFNPEITQNYLPIRKMGKVLFEALGESKFATLVSGLSSEEQLPDPISRHDSDLVQIVQKLGEFNETFDWTAIPIYSDSYTIIDETIVVNHDETLTGERVICGSELIVIEKLAKDFIPSEDLFGQREKEGKELLDRKIANSCKCTINKVCLACYDRRERQSAPQSTVDAIPNNPIAKDNELTVSCERTGQTKEVMDLISNTLTDVNHMVNSFIIAGDCSLKSLTFVATKKDEDWNIIFDSENYLNEVCEKTGVNPSHIFNLVINKLLTSLNEFNKIRLTISKGVDSWDGSVNNTYYQLYSVNEIDVEATFNGSNRQNVLRHNMETANYAHLLLSTIRFQSFLSEKHHLDINRENLQRRAQRYATLAESVIGLIHFSGSADNTFAGRIAGVTNAKVDSLRDNLSDFKSSFGLK